MPTRTAVGMAPGVPTRESRVSAEGRRPPCTLVLLCLVIMGGVLTTPAQSTQLTTSQAALAAVSDQHFSYANDGLYALLAEVRASGVPTADETAPLSNWNALLERSADFRGRPVTIHGTIARNTRWQFESPQHQSLGPISELQLTTPNTPLICKLLLTQDARDLPLGGDVTITAYFLMIQQFYTESRQVRQAAILVGVAPTSIQRRVAAPPAATGPSAAWWLSIVAVGLVAALVLPRLIVRRERDLHELRAEHAAPLSVANDLQKWAEQERDTERR